MKKIFITNILLIFLTIPNISFASSYLLTCLNVENNFTTNIMVDEINRTITFKSSYNPTTKKKYKINRMQNIIFWNNSTVAAFSFSSSGVPTFKLFNLDKMTYNSSGHYAGDIQPYGQLYECFKSN